MKVWLSRLEARSQSVARFCALFGMLGLVTFVLMTNLDVSMRWLLNRPIDGIPDVAPLMIAIVVASFFPLALTERCHVSIEFLGNALGPRARARLEMLVALVTLVFFGLVAWQIIVYTIDLHAMGQTTWVVQIPAAPWWVVVSLFMLLCVVVQLSILLAQISGAKKPGGTDESGPALPEDASDTNGRA
jgi:TRAP-type C4-dicarboxylate transport system permease small subunit